jgi:hypothetical protein
MLRRAAASGREGCSAAPRLGLKANAFSGNQQRVGRALGTFNPLFPRLNVEGQFIVPSNLLEPYPSVTVEPFEGLSIGLGWDFLWRESTQDASGRPTPLPRTAARQAGTPTARHGDPSGVFASDETMDKEQMMQVRPDQLWSKTSGWRSIPSRI